MLSTRRLVPLMLFSNAQVSVTDGRLLSAPIDERSAVQEENVEPAVKVRGVAITCGPLPMSYVKDENELVAPLPAARTANRTVRSVTPVVLSVSENDPVAPVPPPVHASELPVPVAPPLPVQVVPWKSINDASPPVLPEPVRVMLDAARNPETTEGARV